MGNIKIELKLPNVDELKNKSRIFYPAPYTDFSSFFGHGYNYVSDQGGVVWFTNDNVWDFRYNEFDVSAIRPVFTSNILYENIKEEIQNKNNNDPTIEYGSYPQRFATDHEEYKLNALYKRNKLEKTGKIYHLSSNVHDSEKNLEFEEFYFKKNKFILYKKDICLGTTRNYWFKVEPVTWLVDSNTHTFYCKNSIVSGIRPNKIKNIIFDGEADISNILEFLNTYLSKEIFDEETKIEEKETPKIEINTSKNKYELIIDEIRANIKNSVIEDITSSRLDEIINKHNEKLLNQKNIIGQRNTLSFNYSDTNTINKQFELELNNILDKVKEYNKNNEDNNKMLNYLNDSLDILLDNNEEDKDIKDDLQEDLIVIKKYILPYLGSNESTILNNEIINIFDKEKNNLTIYLRNLLNFNNNQSLNKLDYSTLNELKLFLRKQLHPVLGKISSKVKDKDISNEINESLKMVVNSNYEVAKNKYFTIYLNLINETYNEIINNIDRLPEDLSNHYKELLSNSMNININYQGDFDNACKTLSDLWRNLCFIKHNINEYISELDLINNSLVR